MSEEKMKICSKCGRELPANSDYFFRRKANKDGLMGVCKECKSGHPFTNKLYYTSKEGYKICNKCNREYPLTDEYFRKAKFGKDGYRNYCKECERIANKEYKSKNKDKTKKQWNNWYKNNKENISDYNKKYRAENIDKIKNYNNKYQKKYRKTTRGKAIRKKHYHIREAKLKQLEYDFSENDWLRCKEYFNYKCAYCGEESSNLTQDHFIALNNGGTYTKDNIIPCCFSCNSSKQDKDFYDWYKTKDFYNIHRIEKIEKYLNTKI